MGQRIYTAIDLKSFFASIEARERGLDPVNTNLVVVDETRTEKIICLAVPSALKTFGAPGRPRLFEVIVQVKAVNRDRVRRVSRHRLADLSYYLDELRANPALVVDYLVARLRMKLYMETSATVLSRYLHWVSPADVHVYSIGEVFIDAIGYLERYRTIPVELATGLIHDIYAHMGITAMAGIGKNLYLAKVAMGILAKYAEADEHGAHLAELTMRTYREQLWTHRPLTGFRWVGPATTRKLEAMDLFMMGDVVRASLGECYNRANEEVLYRIFGVNAELLTDHVWRWEPTTIVDIKSYHPQAKSVNVGQVLPRVYRSGGARMIVREITDGLSLDSVDRGLTTDQVVLTVGYDTENLADPARMVTYRGEVECDHYGCLVPKLVHGGKNLGRTTIPTWLLLEAVMRLFEWIVDPELLVRRMYMSTSHIHREEALVPKVGVADVADGSGVVGGTGGFMSGEPKSPGVGGRLDSFMDYEALVAVETVEQAAPAAEHCNQEVLLRIKRRFSKNVVFRGVNLSAGVTALDRNRTAGRHRS